jgi:tetratricopeptide (TPR) repeat protein
VVPESRPTILDGEAQSRLTLALTAQILGAGFARRMPVGTMVSTKALRLFGRHLDVIAMTSKSVFCRRNLTHRPAVLSNSTDSDASRRLAWVLGGVLVLAVIAAYWNSLNVPFFFDDRPAIIRNDSIRHLWPPWTALTPPNDGSGVSGRPLTNLSLAVNYAAGGLTVRGYHIVNLTLHILAALTMWGVLRQTLRRPALPARFRERADVIAWSAALLWAVHPLLTESVVCVVQRNEVLGGLFYLLTFYGFIRATDSASAGNTGRNSRGWLVLSAGACFAGVASKEIVATAPVLLWLYDRTFVAGNYRAAWRDRKWFYAALAASWIPLGWLVVHNGQRGGTVGFGLGMSSWHYLLTQCQAITTYLKLSFWPHPLVVDYGTGLAKGIGDVWWQGLIVLTLLVATALALWRRPAAGFLGAWFFGILAPSSSFVPLTTQTIAEHRMYLPLAAPIVAAVLCLSIWLNRRTGWAAALLALALGALTIRRNRDYRSEEAIWSDTVAKRPDNPRAYDGLAYAFVDAGRWQDAIAACESARKVSPDYRGDLAVHMGQARMGLGQPAEALPYFDQILRVKPDDAELHNNFGMALAALLRLPEAIPHYETAVRLNPGLADAHNNLGNALAKSGRLPEAVVQYTAAVQLRPDYAEAESNWARSLSEAGRSMEALPHFETALKLQPGPETHEELARALVAVGRMEDALRHYQAALSLAPDSLEARIALANALVATGQLQPAQAQFEAALRLRPDSAEAHYNLGNLLARQEKFPDAIAHYEAALRSQPRLAGAHHNLALVFMRAGRTSDALGQFEETLRLVPESADAHHELALVLGQLGRPREAETHELAALRLRPDFPEAREYLAWLQEQK